MPRPPIERNRNVFVRALEFLERLPFSFGQTTYFRVPRLGVNREEPQQEMLHSRVPEDVQQEALEREKARRTSRPDRPD